MHIMIDEIRNIDFGVIAGGNRLYTIVHLGLEINIRLHGLPCKINATIGSGSFLGGEEYEIHFSLKNDLFDNNLKVRVSSIELVSKKLNIDLNVDGCGILTYDGSLGEIVSSQVKACRFNISGVFHSIMELDDIISKEEANDIIERYDWEKVEIVLVGDQVLLDAGSVGYIRLSNALGSSVFRNLLFTDECKCFRLRHNDVDYFIAIEFTEYRVRCKCCYLKNGISLMDGVSILSKRLL